MKHPAKIIASAAVAGAAFALGALALAPAQAPRPGHVERADFVWDVASQTPTPSPTDTSTGG